MSNWDFPGAKWWKFDFHTHTPASDDFKKPNFTCEDWLREYMERDIDCAAITDHNCGEWIDKLKQTLAKLEEENPEWYRPLYLFPGVEISANGGVHILAIFDPSKKTADIDSLLGAVGYSGNRGKSDAETEKSITKVIDTIVEAGGIAIPAHVDRDKGLFSIRGQSLQQVLKNSNVYAMELCDKDFPKPELYKSTKTDWIEICGSDFHGKPSDVFTWVKMGAPSIEGLRLALIDGSASVHRDMDTEPNRHAEYVIEEIIVKEAKYIGRPEVLACQFSPFLNTIIGGRGSGKSTLLEFMRLVLRRRQELPARLEDDYQGYFSTDEDGLLTQDSSLRLVYRKGDTRYGLNWDANFEAASLEEQDEETGDWWETEGEIASLFPVSIYSQKQIFELASEPQGLLGVIDRAHEVEFDEYYRAFENCRNSRKEILQQWGQLNQKIAEENKLKGQLNDLKRQIEQVKRQIEQVEKSGHKDALQKFRLRQQQLTEIEYVEQHWEGLFDDMRNVLAEAGMATVNKDLFAKHPEMLATLQGKQRQWQQHIEQILNIVERQAKSLEQWRTEKQGQTWMAVLNQDLQQYEQLRTQLEQQKIDPQIYPTLLQKYSSVEKELKKIADYKEQRDRLGEQYWEKLLDAERNRQELTERRVRFLDRVLEGNKSVKITVKPFAQPWAGMEKTLRAILQVGDRFDKDIESLEEVVDKHGWKQVKQHLEDIRTDKETARDFRFQSHLQGLPGESLVDLQLWFPEDALQITYGENGKRINEGSPGQKSAALLAFILAHGDEPLLLDQPEDDLDNDLIYSLIVQAIKATKTKRQIIVVTHNANIVVNGDCEMVHCLNVANGQSHLISNSLQSEAIRQRICDTMEGGSKAFEQRYKRIHLEI